MNNFTPDLAEICGIHAGDGYLRNDGRRREWDISGSVDEKEYYDRHVIPLFNRSFNLNIKGRYFKGRNTYGFVIREKKVIVFAHDILDFPYGSKSLIVRIPDFIFEKMIFVKRFLRGYFDTDGSFCCFKKSGKYSFFKKNYHAYPRMSFSTVSNNLANDLKILFEHIKLSYCFRKHVPRIKTENIRHIFEINGVTRVKKLMEFTQPKNTTKTTRYKIWLKFGFCPTNITYKQRLNILKGELNPYYLYKDL